MPISSVPTALVVKDSVSCLSIAGEHAELFSRKLPASDRPIAGQFFFDSPGILCGKGVSISVDLSSAERYVVWSDSSASFSPASGIWAAT